MRSSVPRRATPRGCSRRRLRPEEASNVEALVVAAFGGGAGPRYVPGQERIFWCSSAGARSPYWRTQSISDPQLPFVIPAAAHLLLDGIEPSPVARGLQHRNALASVHLLDVGKFHFAWPLHERVDARRPVLAHRRIE